MNTMTSLVFPARAGAPHATGVAGSLAAARVDPEHSSPVRAAGRSSTLVCNFSHYCSTAARVGNARLRGLQYERHHGGCFARYGSPSDPSPDDTTNTGRYGRRCGTSMSPARSEFPLQALPQFFRQRHQAPREDDARTPSPGGNGLWSLNSPGFADRPGSPTAHRTPSSWASRS